MVLTNRHNFDNIYDLMFSSIFIRLVVETKISPSTNLKLKYNNEFMKEKYQIVEQQVFPFISHL